jgi:hypothetical protein
VSVSGNYVKTFAEASHALPASMHMNADYPFMLPRIINIENDMVTIEESGKQATFKILRRPGRTYEFGYIRQSSSFERLFYRKPQLFEMHPFKDRNTPAVGRDQARLF